MATKKPSGTGLLAQEDTSDPLPLEEATKRDSMQVQVLRAQDESPVVIMCKMPRPGRDLAFTATIKKKGADVQIEGTVKSEEPAKK